MAVRLDSIYTRRRPAVLAGGGTLSKPDVLSRPSPNHNSRPSGTKIDTIVLHHTGPGTLDSVARFFQNSASQVSAHYIVGKDGRIVQSVADGERAWHAGSSAFKGRSDVNDFSLGIEIVNDGDGKDPYTDAQYTSLINMVAWMCQHYNVPMDRITGHKNVALPKGRKDDPSSNFDWNRVQRGVQAKLRGGVEPTPPAPKPDPTPAPAPSPNQGDQGLYTVRKDDSLSKIAKAQLGEASRWKEIYELNRDKIKDPNLIYPGQVLRMPARSGATPTPQPKPDPNPAPQPVPQPKPPVSGDPMSPAPLWPLPLPPVVINPTPVAPVNPTPVAPVNPSPVAPVTPAPVTPVNPTPVAPVNPAPIAPADPAPVQPKPPVTPAPVTPVPQPTDSLAGNLRMGGAVLQQIGRNGMVGGGMAGGFMNGGSGVAGSLPGLLKGNFVVAAAVSAASNLLDLVRGKITMKQAIAGFGVDTAAYTGIGAASTYLGAMVGSMLGPVGTIGGMLVGGAIGVGLGWVYEKLVRSKLVQAVSGMIGG